MSDYTPRAAGKVQQRQRRGEVPRRESVPVRPIWRPIRRRGSSFTSRACRSAPTRWRPISASCSAAATITCWRAIAKTAAPPTSGRARLRELLKYAIERGLQRFDFTIGDERYKLEWCDSSLKLYDHAAAATWRGWPAARATAARRRLKRLIKQTPCGTRSPLPALRLAHSRARRGREAGGGSRPPPRTPARRPPVERI